MSPEEDSILKDVIEHLMFHKALIDDHSAEDHTSDYIQMAKEIEKGVFMPTDPFEKAISLVFELVLDEKMNPWDIDLVRFAKVYGERISQSGNVDFVISGRIIYLAWSILKMQSDRALDDVQHSVVQPQPEQQEEVQPVLMDGESLDMPSDPFSDEVGCEIVPDMPPSVRHEAPSRPITLIDLVEAFHDAKDEVRLREIIAQKREQDRHTVPSFQRKVHGEDIEKEICMVWQRILSFNGDPIPLKNIYVKNREDFVTVFISVLFLVKLRKVELWQEGLPNGEIFIKNVCGHVPLTFAKGELGHTMTRDVMKCLAS
jgi:segregation and condensation protein A